MKQLFRCLILSCMAIVVTLVPAQTCDGQVRINEILGDPARDWDGDGTTSFKDDEWLEIVNAGSAPVALDSLRVSDAADVFRYGFSGTLQPGDHVVVLGSESVAWETANGLSTVGLSLNNSGDTVRLWQLAGAETLLVDEYTYAAHEAEDDRSTGRMPDGDGTWMLFDLYNPWTGSAPPTPTGCPPTPGDANACPTAVDDTAWGTMKLKYQPEIGP